MRVTATRSGDWWAVEAEHNGQPIYTQARRLDQVEALVRDAFATLGVDTNEEPMELVPVIESVDVADAARRASREAAAAAKAASDSMRKAIARLQADGLTVRDVAALLDISPQRVSQLATGRTASTRSRGAERQRTARGSGLAVRQKNRLGRGGKTASFKKSSEIDDRRSSKASGTKAKHDL